METPGEVESHAVTLRHGSPGQASLMAEQQLGPSWWVLRRGTSRRRQMRGSGYGGGEQEGPRLVPPSPPLHWQHPQHHRPGCEEGTASAAAQCCSRLLPRPSCLPCESCLSKGIAAAEGHARKLELLKAGTPSQARATLDLNPPIEIISVTLRAVSGFILEFIKFQCHPYS